MATLTLPTTATPEQIREAVFEAALENRGLQMRLYRLGNDPGPEAVYELYVQFCMGRRAVPRVICDRRATRSPGGRKKGSHRDCGRK